MIRSVSSEHAPDSGRSLFPGACRTSPARRCSGTGLPRLFPQAAGTAHRPANRAHARKVCRPCASSRPSRGAGCRRRGFRRCFRRTGRAIRPSPATVRRPSQAVFRRVGADVEQQVSVAARSPHEVVDQRLRSGL